MFEFFKYAADEMRGIDHSQKVKQRQDEHDEKKVLLSSGVRKVIYVLGVLYLVIALLSVSLLKRSNAGIESYYMYLILSAIDVLVLICATLRTKKSELLAIFSIVVFVALLFVFV